MKNQTEKGGWEEVFGSTLEPQGGGGVGQGEGKRLISALLGGGLAAA